MSPERAAALVRRWVRLYTAGLPRSMAQRRIEEVDADLHDHVTHERHRGTPDGRIARAIASRMARGVVADVTWRRQSNREQGMATTPLCRSVVRVTAAVAAVLAIPLLGMAFTDEVAWGVFDFALAGVLLAVIGTSFELALRRRGPVLLGVGVAGLGVAAAVVGELDDAPGLVLLGMLLVAGGAAVAYRRVQRARI